MEKCDSKLFEVFRRLTGGRIARGAGVAAVALLLTAAAVRAQTFSAPFGVSNDSTSDDTNVQVALDSSNNIYVVWRKRTTAPGSTLGIYFSKSTDHGATFSAPKLLSVSTSAAMAAQIAVDSDGHIDVVWQDNYTSDIYFARSTDGGGNFSTPQNLSNTPASSSSSPKLALESNGTIDLVYGDMLTDPGYDIMFARGTVGAGEDVTFTSPVQVSQESAFATAADIAVDSTGKICVAWGNASAYGDVYFRSITTDGGGSPVLNDTTVKLSNASSTDPSGAMLRIDESNNLYVAWTSVRFGEVYFSRSTDGGATFSAPVNVSDTVGSSRSSEMFVDPATENIYLAGRDSTTGTSVENIFVGVSTDHGSNFSWTNVSNNASNAYSPTLGVDWSGNINVAWQDDRVEDGAIYFSRSTDGGATFSEPANISDSPTTTSSAILPRMAVESIGNIDVFWPADDATVSETQHPDLWFSRGTPSGGEPFESFDAKLKFLVGPPPGFNLQASATVPAGSSIDPSAQVTIVAGPQMIAIPAGSFHELLNGKKAGSFVYSGVSALADDVTVNAQIVVLSETEYQIKASASGDSLSDPSGLVDVPVEVVVTVGEYSSSTTVVPSF